MALQAYSEPLLNMTADGPTIATSAAEALICTDFTVNANSLLPSRKLRATIEGRISNVVTAVPTITLRARLGTASLTGTVMATSGAISCRATVATNETWRWEFTLCVRTIGSGGTAMCTGMIWLPNATGATTLNVAGIPFPQTAPATAAVDTTVQNILSITAQWGTSNASNSITVHDYTLEAIP